MIPLLGTPIQQIQVPWDGNSGNVHLML